MRLLLVTCALAVLGLLLWGGLGLRERSATRDDRRERAVRKESAATPPRDTNSVAGKPTASSEPPSSTSGRTVTFVVTSRGRPVEGARVRIAEPEAEGCTAGDGTVVLGRGEELALFTVVKPGFQMVQGVARTPRTKVDLVAAEPRAGTVLIDGAGPAIGVWVGVYQYRFDRLLAPAQRTNDEGRYFIPGVAKWPIRVKIWSPGDALVERVVKQPPLPPIVIGRGGVLERENFEDGDEFHSAVARTDDRGRFVVRGLEVPGRYWITCFTEQGHARAEFRLWKERLAARVELRIRSGATLRLSNIPETAEITLEGGPDAVGLDGEPKDGSCEFRDLTPGRYELRILHPSDLWDVRSFELASGERRDVRLDLPARRTLRGTVRDSLGVARKGIALRTEVVLEGRLAQSDIVMTDSEGRFAIRGYDGRPVLLIINKDWSDGFLREAWSITVGAKPVRVVLRRAAAVSGRLLRRAEWSIEGPGAWSSGDKDRFHYGHCPVGEKFVLTLQVDGFAPRVLEVGPLAPGENRDLGAIALNKGLVCRGMVRDEEGRPVAGAVIWRDLESVARTDRDGRFVLPNLRGGETFEVGAKGWVTRTFAAAAKPVVALRRGSLVRGRLWTAKGEPAVEAPVRIKPGPRSIQVDGNGHFEIRLDPGRYELILHPNLDREGPGTTLHVFEVVAGKTTSFELRLP